MRVIRCAKCGKEVETKGNGQKYCPECAYEIRIERNHERLEARAAMFHDALQAARESGKSAIKTRFAGMRHIKCEKCGADVAVPKRAGRAKYCPRCSQESYRESHRRSKERNAVKLTAICDVCGEEFEYVKKGTNRTTCDACRDAEWAPEKRSEEKKEPVAKIEDLEAAARAKGMSYGQYKAWMYMQKKKA